MSKTKQLGRLSKGTAVYGAGIILNKLFRFLLLPVFTRFLSPNDYGVIGILGFAGFLITTIFQFGFGATIGLLYFKSEEKSNRDETIWTAFFMLCLAAVLVGISGFLFPEQLSLLAFREMTYAKEIAMYLASISIGMVALPFIIRLQYEEKSVLFVILNFVSIFLSTVFSVIFIAILKYRVHGFILAGLLGNIVTLVIFLLVTILQTRIRVRPSLVPSLLRNGIPLVPSYLFIFLIEQSGKYMLQFYSTLEDVGIYNIGYNIGRMMQLFVGAFQTAWYAFFQSFIGKHDDEKKVFSDVFLYYSYVFGALVVCFFLFARPIVLIMTHQSFFEAYKVVGVFSLAYFMVGIFSNLLPGLYYKKKIYFVNISQAVAMITVVVLNVFLIKAFGFVGSAIAVLGGCTIMCIVQFAINKFKKIWMPRYDWRRLLIHAAVSGLFILISFYPLNRGLVFSTTISVILTVGFLVITALQIGKQDRIKIYRLIKSKLRFVKPL